MAVYQTVSALSKRDCCTANKCYTVILAEYSGEVRTVSESDLFLYGLDRRTTPCLQIIEGCVRRLLKQAKGNPVCAETARILEESFKVKTINDILNFLKNLRPVQLR